MSNLHNDDMIDRIATDAYDVAYDVADFLADRGITIDPDGDLLNAVTDAMVMQWASQSWGFDFSLPTAAWHCPSGARAPVVK